MRLMALALAPTLAALFYIRVRDRYEKEPWRLLVVGMIIGIAITYPIIQTENVILSFLPILGTLGEAFYNGFIVAAFTETAFKFVVLYLLIWRNKNLNEPFDGIVYAVFIALGFAGLENVLYVFHPELGGLQTALLRAFLSVPAHGLFAVATGYWFAMARFIIEKQKYYLFLSFFVTWLLHGTYDFLLMAQMPYALLIFIPFMAWMWHSGLKQMKKHVSASPFKNGGDKNNA